MVAEKSVDEPVAIAELDARRRRVRYRAWHRGIKEMDLMLGPFADAHAHLLDGAGLDRLEGLMEEADTDLLKWVMGQEEPPGSVDQELLRRLIDFRLANAVAK
ncbi:MAG TPA: succinate dehydrogenase assembly factor 2 [Devosiaceae bacterium]|jgi:antitoxin CptB|nr:succinate dehydrogenase assembly factor 2 [Devosiaceae bacterium]